MAQFYVQTHVPVQKNSPFIKANCTKARDLPTRCLGSFPQQNDLFGFEHPRLNLFIKEWITPHGIMRCFAEEASQPHTPTALLSLIEEQPGS